jgi:hypothetical protein
MAELNARVPCSDETRNALRDRKRDGERYEEVLARLLRETDENA